METTIPKQQQRLVCNGRELAPLTSTLAAVGVTNGDLIVLMAAPAAAPLTNGTPASAAAAAAEGTRRGWSRTLTAPP
jgi:hypothetical protein